MERAYQRSDAEYDGIFFLGVKSTGIFCRPTCPARKPLPKNVEFFATPKEAMFAGYRACKRCHPLEIAEPPKWVAALLTELEREPTGRIREGRLHELGLDPSRVRRHFQKHYGMSFQAFARAKRLGRAFQQIREGTSLDAIAYDQGFESLSGFRDAFAKTFGEPPGRARSTNASESRVIQIAWQPTPLGPMIAGATERGLCLLEFTDRRMLEAQFVTLRKRIGTVMVPGTNVHLERLARELAAYFAGRLTEFTVELDAPGSEFQRRVWDELLRIPYGDTRSYDAIARAIGSRGAQRAVGKANGENRIAIVIPCHRVVNADGKLGGYGGGVRRKEFLLGLEKRVREGGSQTSI